MILTEIFLPEHAPKRLSDRYTLWNEVEQVEKRADAQLAYSFDIALQNEFSLDEKNLKIIRIITLLSAELPAIFYSQRQTCHFERQKILI